VLLEPKNNENLVEYWQRSNEYNEKILIEKGERKEILKLYCQSCCYRYPNECNDILFLHPYDRAAESCPDFIPKDYYKAKSRAKCWKKRLMIDPEYSPLPNDKVFHPVYWWMPVDSKRHYKIMTKDKAYNFLKEVD